MIFLDMAIFLKEKTMENKKITEMEMINFFKKGEFLLKPLVIEEIKKEVAVSNKLRADALIAAGIPDSNEFYSFIVEMKSSSTPLVVNQAVDQVKSYVGFTDKAVPIIVVPYLSPERLEKLEAEGISGVDLCGNGYINVPGKIYILRTGEKNRYPESRPLSNPYRGRSAMVGRLFLIRNSFKSLKELQKVLGDAGERMVISQVSKAVQALADDLVVSKLDGRVSLFDPLKLLNKLVYNWGERTGKPRFRRSKALKLKDGLNTLSVISKDPSVRWTVTGESSVQKYATFSQGGPKHVVVSDIDIALDLIGDEGKTEHVRNFADVILHETDEPGFFFGKETDSSGVNWAGIVQTYIELANGDGRQLEVAEEIKDKILKEFYK